MATKSFKIDSYSVQLYAVDRKGGRTRWGDKTILLYSGGRVYFAHASQYAAVMDLLRNEKSVYISWKPVSDPKEPQDGDAFFHTDSKPV